MSNPQGIGIIKDDGTFRGFLVSYGVDPYSSYDRHSIEEALSALDTEEELEAWIEMGIQGGGYSTAQDVEDANPYHDGGNRPVIMFPNDQRKSPADLRWKLDQSGAVANGFWSIESADPELIEGLEGLDEQEAQEYIEEQEIEGILVGNWIFSWNNS